MVQWRRLLNLNGDLRRHSPQHERQHCENPPPRPEDMLWRCSTDHMRDSVACPTRRGAHAVYHPAEGGDQGRPTLETLDRASHPL